MKVLCFMILISLQLQAKTLLIPPPNAGFTHYDRACNEPPLICTYDYFTQLIAPHSGERFEQLIDHLDLTSKKFRQQFRNQIISILDSEILDSTQLNLLLALLRQLHSLDPDILFIWIENDLLRIKKAIEQSTSVNNKDFIFIFKKKLPLSHLSKIQSQVLQVPFYRLQFASAPIRGHSKNPLTKPGENLLKGSCDNWILNVVLKTDWQPMNSDCFLTPETHDKTTRAFRL